MSWRRLQSRICRLDDHADRFLVESLESAFALQVLEMAADRSFARELCKLVCVDQILFPQAFEPLFAHGPSFAFCERLLQEREIRKRLHRIDVERGQLLAEQVVIEAAFEMVHARLEKAFAMKANP